MSDTPKTDAFFDSLPAVYDHSDACDNLTTIQREMGILERELAAAIAERDMARKCYTRQIESLHGIEKERDQLRQRVEELESCVKDWCVHVGFTVLEHEQTRQSNERHPGLPHGPCTCVTCTRERYSRELLSTKGGDPSVSNSRADANPVVIAGNAVDAATESPNPSVSGNQATVEAVSYGTEEWVFKKRPTSEPEAGATPETDVFRMELAESTLRAAGWTREGTAPAWKPPIGHELGKRIQQVFELEDQRNAALAEVERLKAEVDRWMCNWNRAYDDQSSEIIDHKKTKADLAAAQVKVAELEKHITKLERAGRV